MDSFLIVLAPTWLDPVPGMHFGCVPPPQMVAWSISVTFYRVFLQFTETLLCPDAVREKEVVMDQLELGCRQEGSIIEAGSQEHDHFWVCVTEEGTEFNIHCLP